MRWGVRVLKNYKRSVETKYWETCCHNGYRRPEYYTSYGAIHDTNEITHTTDCDKGTWYYNIDDYNVILVVFGIK